MIFVWKHTRPRKSKPPFQFWLAFIWVLSEIPLDNANWSNLFNFDPFFESFFVWNQTRRGKSKQPFQFWPVFESFLYEITLDNANRSNLFNFDSFLNAFCMKYYQITKIEATFSILTRFWMLFVWNRFRPRKSKPPFQFWLAFIWYLYEIPLDQANWSNLFNFDKFLNGFCMKAH